MRWRSFSLGSASGSRIDIIGNRQITSCKGSEMKTRELIDKICKDAQTKPSGFDQSALIGCSAAKGPKLASQERPIMLGWVNIIMDANKCSAPAKNAFRISSSCTVGAIIDPIGPMWNILLAQRATSRRAGVLRRHSRMGSTTSSPASTDASSCARAFRLPRSRSETCSPWRRFIRIGWTDWMARNDINIRRAPLRVSGSWG